MNQRQRTNIACAVVCFLFAAVYYYLAISLQPGALLEVISTKFVPRLLATVIGGLSVLLFITTLVGPPPQTTNEDPEQADRGAFYGTMAVAFLSMAAWKMVGFPSIPFLIAGVLVANRNKNTFRIVCVALGATLVLYLMFFQLFELPLPLGLLE